jgi:hypothetical protein
VAGVSVYRSVLSKVQKPANFISGNYDLKYSKFLTDYSQHSKINRMNITGRESCSNSKTSHTETHIKNADIITIKIN